MGGGKLSESPSGFSGAAMGGEHSLILNARIVAGNELFVKAGVLISVHHKSCVKSWRKLFAALDLRATSAIILVPILECVGFSRRIWRSRRPYGKSKWSWISELTPFHSWGGLIFCAASHAIETAGLRIRTFSVAFCLRTYRC